MQYQKGNISIIVSFIIVACVIGLAVYGIKKTSTQSVTEDNSQNTVIVPTSTTAQTKEVTNTPKKNMDKVAKNGDTLIMNYTGKLTDGTVFDSNVDPKFNHVQPFTFTLGAGQVIKGWDEGLVGMKVGEKKTLTISPDKGYGASGTGPIPPNATLIFDVELVGIK